MLEAEQKAEVLRHQARLMVFYAVYEVSLSGDEPNLASARAFYINHAYQLIPRSSFEVALRQATILHQPPPEIADFYGAEIERRFLLDLEVAKRFSADGVVVDGNRLDLADLIEQEQSRLLVLKLSR